MDKSKKLLVDTFGKKIKENIDYATNETNTITGLINPLIQTLGYDITSPAEYQREYKAESYGTHAVDIAIIKNGNPSILFECKKYSHKFTRDNVIQLRKYYSAEKSHGNSNLSLAVLTDGIRYRFFSDVFEKNLLDQTHFLEINLENIDNMSDDAIDFFFSLGKTRLDHNFIKDFAIDRVFFNKIYSKIESEMKAPSKEFITVLLKSSIPQGRNITTTLIERNGPVVRNAIQAYKNMITGIDDPIIDSPFIETTPTEVSGFQVVLSLLQKRIDIMRLKHEDTEPCFMIRLDSNEDKPVCSLWFNNDKDLQVCFYDSNITGEKVKINNINEIEEYKNRLIETINKYEPELLKPDETPKKITKTYKNGTYEGLSIQIMKSGELIPVPHGKGEFKLSDGTKKSGNWIKGKFIEGNIYKRSGQIKRIVKPGE